MKKTIFTIISILIGFFGITFANLEFTNYKVFGNIQNDGTINVRENIDVHFFNQMHGIERIFNNSYTVEDIEFATVVDNISVPDYNYKIIDDYYQKNIRIGDADVYVDGDKSYEIDYDIYGLIRNFSGMGYSELYRNVIGYGRSNSINNVQIELSLPKAYTGLTKDDFLISAGYTDKYSIDDFDGIVTRDENKIYITYNKRLDSYNGITLAIKFPNNYFEFDHSKQKSLLVGYTHDFNIRNYKLFGTIEKDGNIKFQNDIELEILNSNCTIRAELPYRYAADGDDYLIQLQDLEINGVKKGIEKYDTTNLATYFIVPGDFVNNTTISGNYSIFGLIRPFSGNYKDRAYRLYIPLPILNLSQDIENLELILDVPGGCKNLYKYKENISVNAYGKKVGLDEYNEKYGTIGCDDNKLIMTLSGGFEDGNKFGIYINFAKGTFDLNEELLQALASTIDGEGYYTDKTNRQSILFAIGILLFGGGFKALMKRRYKNQSMMNNKYPIYFDAPKGVDSPEAGVLVDNRIDPKDLTALIYERAINHYIKIFVEKDDIKKYYIKKLKELPGNSKEYQLNLFNSLFKDGDEFHFSRTSSFRKPLSKANTDLKKYINKQNWFKGEFTSGMGQGFTCATGCLVFGVAFLGIIPYLAVVSILNKHLIPVSNRVLIAGVISFILIVTSYRNYKKETNTEKGQELRNHCLGFKDFLMKVDKEKLEFLLKSDPLYLEKSLPYAIVFGVESEFIKNITPEMIEEWDWFEGDFDYFDDTIRYINNYNTRNLAPVSSGSSSSHSTSYSSSGGFSSGSSFGGGFHSGGGGGGGGGGGW